jgi:outer membrane protein OmpA-like peptidoglycan-associated protein
MSDHPLRIVPNQATPSEPAAPNSFAPVPPAPETPVNDQAKLAELRRLLLTPEQEQLTQIQTQLNDHRGRVNDLSRLLPDAVRTRNERDEALTAALTHNIGPALKQAIKHDPSAVIEAVTPVIGPAIRQAITKALNEFVQSVDETMKYSFSAQGMKWRMEAFTTGRSFAEVVMYHTLVYRVEQAFLFHKKTGLLLQHVALPTVASKDADMISGLLTAINDFAHESFTTTEEQTLMKLDYGELEVWIEGGTPPVDLAYIAVVINGNAPEGLRTEVLLPALENIHGKLRDELLTFDGDTQPFELGQPQLEDCLKAQYSGKSPVTESPKGFQLPPSVAVPLALLLIILTIWGGFTWRAQRRWNMYLDRLQTEPGLVVTEQRRTGSKLFGARFAVEGLRDPLAQDPAQLLSALNIAPDDVTSAWKPYHSLDPAFVLARATRVLEPPASVQLRVENGVLFASGDPMQDWLVRARQLTRALPGITRLDESELLTAETKELLKLKAELQRATILFKVGTAQLAPGQAASLQTLTGQAKRTLTLAAATGRELQIEISGHTDTEGSPELNQRLSQARADYVLNALAASGIPRDRLTTVGVGTTIPLRIENSNVDKQLNRRASFRIKGLD